MNLLPMVFTRRTTTPASISGISQDMSGYLATGYVHFTYVISGIKFGLGPKFGYANQNKDNLSANLTKYELTFLRYGGEMAMSLITLPLIQPFMKFGLGKDVVTWTTDGSPNGTQLHEVDGFGGLFFELLIGVKLPINDRFGIYVQGGSTSSTYSSFYNKTLTINGTTTNNAQPAFTYDLKYSAFILGAGIVFCF